MSTVGASIGTAFDYVWQRFVARLEGLTDDEYFWEPVAPCWSLRHGADGRWELDGAGGPSSVEPAPFTTIAWRIGHVAGSAVGGFAERLFDDHEELAFPTTGAAVEPFVDHQYRRWRAGVEAMSEADWSLPLGAAWGPYARDTRLDLALHVFDEVVHHTAEVALLRDLYAHRSSLHA